MVQGILAVLTCGIYAKLCSSIYAGANTFRLNNIILKCDKSLSLNFVLQFINKSILQPVYDSI